MGSRRWVRAGLLLFGLCACAGIGYVGRDPLATLAFRMGLSWKDGFHCSHPRLAVSPDLRQISVTPFACHLSRTPVRYFEAGAATITLRHFTVEYIHVDSAMLDYRPRDVSHVQLNTLGELSQAAGISTGFVKSMLDASEMYDADSPPLLIERLLAKRAGAPESRMLRFHKSVRGVWNRTQIERLEPTAQAAVKVHDLDMEVTPTRGRMRAALRVGPAPSIRLDLRAVALDTDAPRMKLSL